MLASGLALGRLGRHVRKQLGNLARRGLLGWLVGWLVGPLVGWLDGWLADGKLVSRLDVGLFVCGTLARSTV